MARLTFTTQLVAAASVVAVGLSSPAFAGGPIKIGGSSGGHSGVLTIGKNGMSYHGTGRPAPLYKQGVYKPGYGGATWSYGPGYGVVTGVGLAAGLTGAALAARSYDPLPDDDCYVTVRRFYLPDGSVRIRHISRCD